MRAGPGSLQLTGFKYNIISAIFFIPYVLFQPPATVLLRKIGPKYFLSGITIAWGATMIVSLNIDTPSSSANVSRALVSSRIGKSSSVCVSFSVSWKLVSSQVVLSKSQTCLSKGRAMVDVAI